MFEQMWIVSQLIIFFFLSYHTIVTYVLILLHYVADLLLCLSVRAGDSVRSYVIMDRMARAPLIFQVKKTKKKTLFMFASIVTQDHLKEELGVPAQTVGSCTQLSHDSHLGLFDLCKYSLIIGTIRWFIFLLFCIVFIKCTVWAYNSLLRFFFTAFILLSYSILYYFWLWD